MMLSPSTVPWDPCPLGSALAPSLPLSAAGAGVSQDAVREWMQLEGLGGKGLQGPALPLLPFPGKQAGRRQASRQEGRGAATLEDTAQGGGGEPDALPWFCWMWNPHLAGMLIAAKGLLPTLSQQGAPPSWRQGHLQVPASSPGR